MLNLQTQSQHTALHEAFWLSCFIGPLVAMLLHILVEDVLSFKMSGQFTSKMRKCEATSNYYVIINKFHSFTKSLILVFQDYFLQNLTLKKKIELINPT